MKSEEIKIPGTKLDAKRVEIALERSKIALLNYVLWLHRKLEAASKAVKLFDCV
jgi:hypothetical protein